MKTFLVAGLFCSFITLTACGGMEEESETENGVNTNPDSEIVDGGSADNNGDELGKLPDPEVNETPVPAPTLPPASSEVVWLFKDLGKFEDVSTLYFSYIGEQSTDSANFSIEVSDDASQWTRVYSGESTMNDSGRQRIDISPVATRYIRVIAHQVNQFDDVITPDASIEIAQPATLPDPEPQPEPLPETTPQPSWITASSDDGNKAENVYDNIISEKSRWSAQGNNEWLQFDFEEVRNIDSLSIAFYQGDERTQYFSIELSSDGESWIKAYEGMSCGKTSDLEKFVFSQSYSGRYLRIVGQGTSVNDWNSLTEVKFGDDKGQLYTSQPGLSGKVIPIFTTVSASSEHVMPAMNTLDNSLVEKSHWVGAGNEQWLEYDLGKQQSLYGWNVAFFESDKQKQRFAIDVKTESGNWQEVYAGESRTDDPEFQTFLFSRQDARYVRLRATSNQRLAVLEVSPVTKEYFVSTGVTYHVSPSGSDSNSGVSAAEAFKTIQHALDLAQPGDRVLLAKGRYYQDAETVRSGTKTLPITIEGPSDAIVHGERGGRVLQSTHSYIHFLGFTIDGMVNEGKTVDDYREKLLYIIGEEAYKGPRGLVIRGMNFLNAGGECLRLRYYVVGADVSYNYFENCGVRGFLFNTGGKNGEAIYLGTASGQWADGKNPTTGADVSSSNRVHHNLFDTKGNECIDIKEGSINNYIEYNYCTGQRDPNSGGYDSRGNFNVIRYNVAENNIGAGIRLGGHTVNGQAHGEHNDVYGNVLIHNEGGPIKFVSRSHNQVCENVTEGSLQESIDYDGVYRGIDIVSPCGSSTTRL